MGIGGGGWVGWMGGWAEGQKVGGWWTVGAWGVGAIQMSLGFVLILELLWRVEEFKIHWAAF